MKARGCLTLLLLIVPLAGCTQTPPKDSGATPSGTDLPTSSSVPPCDLETCPTPLPTPVLNVTMSDCWGYQHNFPTPKGTFTPEYPSGFQNTGPAIEETALLIYVCRQAVLGPVVVDGLEFAFFVSVLDNPDDAENETDSQHFAWEFFSNSPDFIALAAQNGLNVTLAPNFGPVKRTPTYPPIDVTQYVYPSDTKHYNVTAEVEYDPGEGVNQWYSSTYYETAAGVRRLFLKEDGDQATAAHGVIEFGPSSYWAKHSASSRAEILLNYNEGTALELTFDAVFLRK